MKKSELNHGQRLAEMIATAWKFQATAARALKVENNTLYGWVRCKTLNPLWFKRYGDAFMAFGLNPEYIRDPKAQMFLDAKPAEVEERIGEVQA